MVTHQRSQLHQSAIDKLKIDNDRNLKRELAVSKKVEQCRDAASAMKEYKDQQIATLAKTARLRAERLARTDEAGPVNKLKG